MPLVPITTKDVSPEMTFHARKLQLIAWLLHTAIQWLADGLITG